MQQLRSTSWKITEKDVTATNATPRETEPKIEEETVFVSKEHIEKLTRR